MSKPAQLATVLIVSSKGSLGQYVVIEDCELGNIRSYLDGPTFLDKVIYDAYVAAHPDVSIANVANNISGMYCTENTFEYKCAVAVRAEDENNNEGVLSDMLDIYVFRDSIVDKETE